MRKPKARSSRRFVASLEHLTIRRDGKVIKRPAYEPRRVELSGVGPVTIDLAKGDHSSRTHPWPADKPGKNWIEQIGGKLPPFIKRVAKHIMADSGYPQSRAIAAAISQCKKGRLGKKGLAAAAQWEALKARARAS